MRIIASDNERIVERPAQDAPFRVLNYQIECGALADDKFRVEHTAHFLPNTVTSDGSDKSQIADVDAENWNPCATKAMCRLQQCSITATGNDEISLLVPQIAQLAVKIALGWQSFHPFLLHPLAIQHRFECASRLGGVYFRPVDNNDDFADFHTELLLFIKPDTRHPSEQIIIA